MAAGVESGRARRTVWPSDFAEMVNAGRPQAWSLDVRRQQEEAHDLADAGARHMAQAGQLGLVLDRAGSDQPVEP
jgi:hypothetical protein